MSCTYSVGEHKFSTYQEALNYTAKMAAEKGPITPFEFFSSPIIADSATLSTAIETAVAKIATGNHTGVTKLIDAVTKNAYAPKWDPVTEGLLSHLRTTTGTYIHGYMATRAGGSSVTIEAGGKTYTGDPNTVRRLMASDIVGIGKKLQPTALSTWDGVTELVMEFPDKNNGTKRIHFVENAAKIPSSYDHNTDVYFNKATQGVEINQLEKILSGFSIYGKDERAVFAGLDTIIDPRKYRIILPEVKVAIKVTDLDKSNPAVLDLITRGIDYIEGVIDCIAVDNNDNVFIYDYKTHYGQHAYSNELQELQLLLYKHMLEKALGNSFAVNSTQIIHIMSPLNATSKFTQLHASNVADSKAKASSYAKELLPELKLRAASIAALTGETDKKIKTIFSKHEDQTWYRKLYIDKLKKLKEKHIDTTKVLSNGTTAVKDLDLIIISKSNFTYDEGTDTLSGTICLRNASTGVETVVDINTFLSNELSSWEKSHNERTVNIIASLSNIIANYTLDFNDVGLEADVQAALTLVMGPYGKMHSRGLFRIFEKYLHGGWTVIDHPGLASLGIMLLYDTMNDVYDVIRLSSFSSTSPNSQYSMARGQNNILGDLFTDSEVKNENLPVNTLGNIEQMKLLIALNHFAPTIADNFKVGTIRNISTETGCEISADASVEQLQNALEKLKRLKGGDSEYDLTSKSAITYIDRIELIYLEIVAWGMEDSISGLLDWAAPNTPVMDRLAKIQQLMDTIKREHGSDLAQNRSTQEDSSNNAWARAYNTLQELYMLYSGIEVKPTTASKRAIDSSNSVGVFHDIFKNNGIVRKYSSCGYTLTGLTQGWYTATAFNNPDNAVHEVNKLISNVISKVRMKALDSEKELYEATDKFLNERRSYLGQAFSGNNKDVYSELFVRTSDGEIDPSLMFLDPYSASMTSTAREYLEVVLWQFNRIRDNEIKLEHKELSYNDFKHKCPEEYKAYIERVKSASYLRLYPPMKTRNSGRSITLIRSRKDARLWFQNIVDAWANDINPNHLSESERSGLDELLKTMTMYELFTDEARDAILQNTPLSQFEFNVERVAAEFSFASLKKSYYDHTLKEIDALIGCLQTYSTMTGLDVSASIEAIQQRIKIALFSSNICEKDLSEVNKVVSALRHVNSLLKIAGRPVLMIKEMIVSSTKILAKAKFGFFEGGELTAKHMKAAYGVVFSFKLGIETGHNIFDLGQMGKVMALNARYGVANRDINTTVLKNIRDRHGAHNAMELFAYINTTAPDYFNRNAIFIACMMKDGCYDAYTMKNNVLQYDMAKDKRFSEYWAHKDDASYHTETFAKQKALYMTMVKLFNSEGIRVEVGEKLPEAYTNKQKQNILELINTVLGAFDHELGANFQKAQYALFYMQFLNYISAETKKMFTTNNGNTMMGKFVAAKSEDGKLLYIKDVDPLTGKEILTEDEFDEQGNRRTQYMEWVASPHEGIMVSFLKTCSDVFNPKASFREKLKSTDPVDQRQVANTKIFLFNIGMLLLFGTLSTMIGMWIKEKLKGKKKAEKQRMAAEKAAAAAIVDMADRINSEYSIYHSIAEPILKTNIAGINVLQEGARRSLRIISADSGADVFKEVSKMWKTVDDTRTYQYMKDSGQFDD